MSIKKGTTNVSFFLQAPVSRGVQAVSEMWDPIVNCAASKALDAYPSVKFMPAFLAFRLLQP